MMFAGHLTKCWCWTKTSPVTIDHHLKQHEMFDTVEISNLRLIALEVASWPLIDSLTNPRKEAQ